MNFKVKVHSKTGLNLREKRDVTSAKLGHFSNGQELEVARTSPGWWRVVSPQEGYVMSKYTERV